MFLLSSSQKAELVLNWGFPWSAAPAPLPEPPAVDLSAKLPALDGDGSGLALAAVRFRSLMVIVG